MPQVLELVDAAGRVVGLDTLGIRPALKQNQRELFAQVHFAPSLAQAPVQEQRAKGYGEYRRRRLHYASPLMDVAEP